MWVRAGVAALAIWAARLISQYLRHLKSVAYLPGVRPPFDPLAFPGAIIPTTWWNPGLNWNWSWRKWIYRHYESETVSLVPWHSGRPYILTSSIELARQVTHSQAPFRKIGGGKKNSVMQFGVNVVTAMGEDYVRHRRITAPTFNPQTYDMVCTESVKLYHEMIESEGWTGRKDVFVGSINEYTSKFAMLIISRCGFGLMTPWHEEQEALSEVMTFHRSLSIVISKAALWRVLPRWIFSLPFRSLQTIKQAHEELPRQMTSLIENRRIELGSIAEDTLKHDILSLLIRANIEDSKFSLNDEEVIGNTYVFMLAGHETTAHVLVAALALLALHPEEQDVAVAQIQDVLADRDPVFSDIPKLDKVSAVFQEAARMFSAAFFIVRDSEEPVTLQLPEGQNPRTLSLPANQRVMIDMIGLHHNPRLFPKPETFQPSRWYGVEHDSDFSFFGFGIRMCMGRKFAMTEAVTFLSLILRDWQVKPTLYVGETPAEWQERVMQGRFLGLTFGIPNVPLTFTRR